MKIIRGPITALTVLLIMMAVVLIRCGGGGGGGGTPAVTLNSITVTASTPTTFIWDTRQFTATGNYSDGTSPNITSQVTWTSSNPSVATINNSGLATAVGPGTASIIATSGSRTGGALLTVPTPTSSTFLVEDHPIGIAIDASGNAWVANSGSSSVSVLTPTGLLLNTLPTGSFPRSVKIDASGNVWVTNQNDDTIYVYDSAGSQIDTLNTGNGPHVISIDHSGNAWVTNYIDHNVTIFSTTPTRTTLDTRSTTTRPWGITHDASGNAWVANYGLTSEVTATLRHVVTKLTPAGSIIASYVVGTGPRASKIDPSGNVWVTNTGDAYGSPGNGTIGSSVTKLSPTGAHLGEFTVKVDGSPRGIAINASGLVWVENYGTDTFPKSSVSVLNSSGTVMGEYATGSNPTNMAIDSSGNVWVTNYGDGTVTLWKNVSTPGYRPYPGPIWP